MKCDNCSNYKKKLGRWQKIWEVCEDFDSKTGTQPIWWCLFVPILAPLVYLGYYYTDRRRRR